MTTAGELFENAISHWRDNKGKGTAIIPYPFNDKIMVLGVLQRIYARSPTAETIVVTNTFNERRNLIDFLTQQEEEENNQEFKNLINSKTLKIFTIDLVKSSKYRVKPFVTIMYHIDELCENMIRLLIESKFKLVVLNKLMASQEDMNKLYSIIPLLDDFKQNELDELRISTPVEDSWIGIDIPEDSETKKHLDLYNEYITTSLSIFGSFEVIEQANIGNSKLNMSAMDICAKIAQENGWNEHLDMSTEYNVQIDMLYNPASIKDRAKLTYDMIRNRAILLSDYEGKLDEILHIVEENKGKKILIINKRGEFANKVTDYLNNMSETIICGNYHDKVEPIPAVYDGKPLFYKSGEKKGQRKYMAAQAQKTYNQELFNTNKLNVLSTTAAPDKNLNIGVDIIIITSPQCEDIKSYMYRLSNVYYPNKCISLYNLYVKNSLEQTKLENKPLANNHTIYNKIENNVINKNNFDFVLVD